MAIKDTESSQKESFEIVEKADVERLDYAYLIDSILKKVMKSFFASFSHLFQDFSKQFLSADGSALKSVDEFVEGFINRLKERHSEFPAEELSLDGLQIRHYPRQYLDLYFMQIVDTVFDFVDQCSTDCRVYLKNMVDDFLSNYVFRNN